MKRSILSFAIALAALLTIATTSAQAQNTFWHKTGGPQGGAVGDISADSSGRVWISILRDGVWFSDDHGNTWDSITRGLPSPNVKAICASNDGFVYITSIKQDMLWRLNTNKPNRADWIWENVTPDPGKDNSISCMVTTPDHGVIVLGTGLNDTTHKLYGAIISLDNGTTWKSLVKDSLTAVDSIGDADLIAQGKKLEYVIYHRFNRSVWITEDDGGTWTKIPVAVPSNKIVTAMQVARTGQAGMSIVIGTKKAFSGNPEGGSIYTWNGSAWLTSYQGPTNPQGGKNDDHIDDIVKVKMKNQVSDILYANYHGRTLRSTDLGLSWVTTDSIKRGDEPFQITAEKNDNGDTFLYQECEPDGIHRSSDHGYTWVEGLNDGLNLQLMFDGAIDTVSATGKTTPVLYGVIEFGLCSSTDLGKTWRGPEEFGTESYTNSLWIAPNGNVVAGTDAGVFISKDHGETVSLVQEVSGGVATMASVFDHIFTDTTWVYAAFFDTLIRSSDNGEHWQAAPRDGIPVAERPFQFIALAGSQDTLIGTSLGGTYRSINAGRTWSKINNPQSQSIVLNPSKLIIHTDGSYLCFVSGLPQNGGGAWRLPPGQSDWVKIFPPEGFKDPIPTDFFGLNNDSRGTIFVCSDSGLWRSEGSPTDYSHWTNVGSGLYFDGLEYTKKQAIAGAVVQYSKGDKYYAFARGLSVWESTNMNNPASVPWTTASKNPSIIGYPNPFISSTTLQFELKEASQVHIEVLDVMGRVVANIPTSYFDSGKHTVSFEAGSLETGNYMVVLRAGETTQTGWITLTK
jgi:photosystem II stability/assembly factor-like uncharacterized protein